MVFDSMSWKLMVSHYVHCFRGGEARPAWEPPPSVRGVGACGGVGYPPGVGGVGACVKDGPGHLMICRGINGI